jgi:phosphate transport system protein
MSDATTPSSQVDRRIAQLFALVSEALARATDALLGGQVSIGQGVVDDDPEIDDLARQLSQYVWEQLESTVPPIDELRHWVGVLLILPELERSADLAEHIAQRAVQNLGAEMSPASRGYVQRMSEVAIDMWRVAATAYMDRSAQGVQLEEADEEIDILHDRLTREVASESMPTNVAGEVILVGRFYERLGDHAVNLARRIGTLPESQSNT